MSFGNYGDDTDNQKKMFLWLLSWNLKISMETENNHGGRPYEKYANCSKVK